MAGEYNIEVELDIFSGRPNPRWMLSREQAGRLHDQFSERIPAEPQEAPGLGYRGFVLTNLGQDRCIPHRFRVYSSVVTVMERGGTTYYRDTQSLEEVLLAHARQLGYGDVIDLFRGASGKP